MTGESDAPETPAAARLLEARVPDACAGQRLDRVLAVVFPQYSRSVLQRWLGEGRVRLDDRIPRQRDRVHGGQRVVLEVPPPATVRAQAEALPLRVMYRDADVVVIDKPAGLVVHPGAGNPNGTLVNALLHHFPDLAVLPRAGVVHRLDKGTSGVLVVARNEAARRHLIEALKARGVRREYVAVTRGVLIAGGTVKTGIGRHRTDRLRMSVSERGRPAVTHYRVAARYRAHSLLNVSLETGRTHQIRVHLAHLGHPIVGDPLYGGRLSVPAGATERLAAALHALRRQALHARRLVFAHPATGAEMPFESPLPPDMTELIDALAEDASVHGRHE